MSARTDAAASLVELVLARLSAVDGWEAETKALERALGLLGQSPEARRKQRKRAVPQSKWADLRRLVLERDGYTCRYCATPIAGSSAHVDHVVPQSRGGSDDPANLVAACADCNVSKGARTPEEWRQ